MNSISSNLNLMIKASESFESYIRDFGELENLQVQKKTKRFCDQN